MAMLAYIVVHALVLLEANVDKGLAVERCVTE